MLAGSPGGPRIFFHWNDRQSLGTARRDSTRKTGVSMRPIRFRWSHPEGKEKRPSSRIREFERTRQTTDRAPGADRTSQRIGPQSALAGGSSRKVAETRRRRLLGFGLVDRPVFSSVSLRTKATTVPILPVALASIEGGIVMTLLRQYDASSSAVHDSWGSGRTGSVEACRTRGLPRVARR